MLTFHNRVEIFDTGESKFASLLHELGKAKKFIHMQYYVWEDDALGQKIGTILKLKAKQGIEIRILIDFEGSFTTVVKGNYLRDLRESGVDIRTNQQWWNLFQFNRQNYRDHRKLVVIDGARGYFGGMNVGENYIDGGKKFPAWIDAHAKVEGEAVDCLQLLFAQTWFLLTDEVLDEQYFNTSQIAIEDITPLDLTVSGPTFPRETTKQLYIAMISNAKRRVWIESPYCVPDAAIQEALCVAALSGVDVRIVMTGMADKKLPFWAASSYYPYLLKSGVKLYQYKSGFLHSKVVVMDDDFSCLGTMNLDNRSFRLNYEFTGLFYSKEQNQRIGGIVERDLLQCQEIKVESLNKLPIHIKIRNGISALFSPIL